jgi:acyl-coenzyme A thioesterase PaaI-like protein
MSTPNLDTISAVLIGSVPFAKTLGIQFTAIRATDSGWEADLELPDAAPNHNHVGGPHAGALYTLGETASGAAGFLAFADLLGTAVPLTVRGEITYRKLAMGTVTATARLTTAEASRVRAALAAGERPEYPVTVEIFRADGTVAAEMTVVWTLRRTG